jgi:uncharacterized protein (TIGR02172 family)
MKSSVENNLLIIRLEGRIDSSNAQETQEEINRILKENPGMDFLFDAENLSYISSAGLRILLNIHKTVKPGFTLRNVSPDIYDLLEMSGFITFLDVKKKPRTISVEGCPLIGKGAIGEVYRLDADTIVKVYNIDNLPMIENEQKRSRQAFLKGIPTAIPLDIVKVGVRYGSVFEMIKAANCNDLLAAEPGRLEEITGMYAAFLKQVHGALSDPGELPDTREEYIRYLDAVSEVLPVDVCERIRTLIREMPEDLHMIHGDIQLKNIMFSNGEMILIDMETLSCGNPVFDLAGMYMAYIAFCEDDPENSMEFFGLPAETSAELFFGTLRKYLEAENEEAFRAALDKITLLAYVRFLFVLSLIGGGKPECHDRRIAHSREHLEELSARVKELSI